MSASGLVRARIGSGPFIRYRLPVGGLIEILEVTGKDPAGIMAALEGPPSREITDLNLLDVAQEGAKADEELKELITIVLETAARWAGDLDKYERTVTPYIKHNDWQDLIGLTGEVLAAASGYNAQEPFPPAKVKDRSAEPAEVKFQASVYWQLAGTLGLIPSELMQMSLWQIAHYAAGFERGKGVNTMTEDEASKLGAMVDAVEAEISKSTIDNT